MPLRVDERIVAGREGDELVVHHLSLRGSNRAIGRHLGELARARYGVAPPRAGDPLVARVRREWLRRNAPALFERMRGAAEALGVDLADDASDVSRLGAPPAATGCSAVFLPPGRAAAGRPLVSRAFDFAGPLAAPRGAGPLPAGRPYVLELHPDEGTPSLALCAFDLLGGALDGVNAEGLVALVATDLEAAGAAPPEPAGAVGLDELQLVRHVLETCATAREARAALLGARHELVAQPSHLLVADRHGDAFVFELSPGRDRVHVVDASGDALVLTNHPLHRYADPADLPRAPGPAGSYARWRALAGAVLAGEAPLDGEALCGAAARAFAARADRPLRTVWHALYDPAARSLAARFLPNEAGEGGAPAPTLHFELAA